MSNVEYTLDSNDPFFVVGQKRILVDVERKQIEKKRETVANVESFISKHDRILAQIKEFCEEPNTDRLPALFMKQEEENFALFNYVNEINNEVSWNFWNIHCRYTNLKKILYDFF